MAETFTPVTTSNLTNQTSITNAIDENFATVATLLEDVLSREGNTPNQMLSSLDMNSNQVINVGAPTTPNSAARLIDLAQAASSAQTVTNATTVFNAQTVTNATTVDSATTVTNSTITDIGTAGTVGTATTVTNATSVTGSVGTITNFFAASTFATRAAAIAADITNTSVAFTGGYTNIGDGGGAKYYKTGGSTIGGFQSADGSWWALADLDVNICQLGAQTGSGNSVATTLALNNAIALQNARSVSGRVIIPTGAWYFTPASGNVCVNLVANGNSVIIQGSGRDKTSLFVTGNYNLMTITSNYCGIYDLSMYGYNSISASFPTLALDYGSPIQNNAQGSTIARCNLYYGTYPLQVQTGDMLVEDCYITSGFLSNVYIGNSSVTSGSQAWLRRVKIDQSGTALPPNTDPFTLGWVAGHTYTTGTTVLVETGSVFYLMQVVTSGGVSSQAPIPTGYGSLVLSDGYTWTLAAPLNLVGLHFDTNAFQCHAEQCDITGFYEHCVRLDNQFSAQPASGIYLTSCALGGGYSTAIHALFGAYLSVTNCEISGVSSQPSEGAVILFGTTFTGPATISACNLYGATYYQTTYNGIWIAGGSNITTTGCTFGPFSSNGVLIAAGINDITVTGSRFISCNTAVTVQPGTSTGLIISQNNWRSCSTGLQTAGATLVDSTTSPNS